jgi:iduronate 2-sulfatase
VLFIAVDDLRPEGGAFGTPSVKTPHIDDLARRGITFSRAYAQQAVCSPSRTSLLTGLRPDTTRIYDLQTHFRATVPDVVTLPAHFKRHGYHAQGFGKVYHGGLDDPQSWSVPLWMPTVPWNEAYG